MRHARRRHVPGFTLVELLVVLAIVALLLTISLPRYFQSLDSAREAVLSDNLRNTRQTIDNFYSDTGRYPRSLDELVDRKYLRTLPMDPITDSQTSWVIVPPAEGDKGEVYNIRSSAPGSARNGRPFADF